MPEQYDHNWGEVNHRGRTVFFMALTMLICGVTYGIGSLTNELEHNFNDGFRIAVTEPINEFVDKINNTGDLKEYIILSNFFCVATIFYCIGTSKQSRAQNT